MYCNEDNDIVHIISIQITGTKTKLVLYFHQAFLKSIQSTWFITMKKKKLAMHGLV